MADYVVSYQKKPALRDVARRASLPLSQRIFTSSLLPKVPN
jgi:hypothetical protein